MPFDYQPELSGDLLRLRSLTAKDFDSLYGVASDPHIWKLHPVPNRYEQVFRSTALFPLRQGQPGPGTMGVSSQSHPRS